MNYFSPSAFSRRLVAGKKLVFVSFLSVESASRNTSAVHSAGEGPASSGDPSVSAGAASLYGLMTQQGPQQPRCSLPSDCSRTEGLPLVSSPRSHRRATTGQDGKSTEPPYHGASAFPPLLGQNFARESGRIRGKGTEGIYYGESRPDSGKSPEKARRKSVWGIQTQHGNSTHSESGISSFVQRR